MANMNLGRRTRITNAELEYIKAQFVGSESLLTDYQAGAFACGLVKALLAEREEYERLTQLLDAYKVHFNQASTAFGHLVDSVGISEKL